MSKLTAKRIPAERCHFYGIRSIHALAKRLDWDLSKLENIAVNGGYRVYSHKLTGRVIQEPSEILQKLHKKIHKYLSRIEVPDYLHSAVKGRSYLSNAKMHVNEETLIKIDIKKFFPSVPQHKVVSFFHNDLKCAKDVSVLIAKVICYNGKLATGSSVSPIISYYAFKSMFDEISVLATKYNLSMTCYVDDITLSGKQASALVLHEIRTIIYKAGLKAHKEKCFRADSPKLVTGVIIANKTVHLPFKRWKKIKMQLRELSDCVNDEEKLTIISKLTSRLYEAAQIEGRCRKMAEFHHAEWRALKARIP